MQDTVLTILYSLPYFILQQPITLHLLILPTFWVVIVIIPILQMIEMRQREVQ